MTSLDDIKAELIGNVKFQSTPIPMADTDYLSFTIQGAKRLYVDEGIEDNWKADYDKVSNTLARDLSLTEAEYAWTCAEINFRTQIKDDLAQITGFTTDALSITNADKPYKNAETTIEALEKRLARLAFDFTHQNPVVFSPPYNKYSFNDYNDFPYGNDTVIESGTLI